MTGLWITRCVGVEVTVCGEALHLCERVRSHGEGEYEDVRLRWSWCLSQLDPWLPGRATIMVIMNNGDRHGALVFVLCCGVDVWLSCVLG